MLTQTIRTTFRSWRRTPMLAATVLVTLSLGVGFNAAIFSVVHAVLFRPLPYPASERLVELFEVDPAARGFRVSVLNVKLGRRSEARAVLNELLARRHTEYIDSYAIARLRHALGDVDAAFVELARAIDESVGGLYAIRFDPLLDGFRSDRRFSRLLKRYLTPVELAARQSAHSIA